MKPTTSSGIACFALIALFCLAGAAFGQATSPLPELAGEVMFTIPWGEDWGKLKFISEKDLSEATYSGPEAMFVAGDIYLYDPIPRRLSKFGADGKFLTGAQLTGGGLPIRWMGEGPSSKGAIPILTFDGFDYMGKLDELPATPGPLSLTQIKSAAFAVRTRVHRVGAIKHSIFVEQSGSSDIMPYICQYGEDRLYRRFEAVDLTPLYPWYYALALDYGCAKLFSPVPNQVVLQQIDASEGTVVKESILTLPEVMDKADRWHLVGATRTDGGTVFLFTRRWPVWADDLIYVISEKGIVIGTAKVAVPGGIERGQYLKSWNHHVSVMMNGLYIGVPENKGFTIVRYKIPTVNK
ncbi:MAG: hypothetical protein Q7N50_07430 [Armatimonadota bacterium]|nr:hypothetical protein [Armatimonadota bacterium]